MSDVTQASREMPRYKCHKEVWALKIASVEGFRITPADEGYAPFDVEPPVFARYTPVPGDYYVVYSDGYAAISPAKAFEEGYSPIDKRFFTGASPSPCPPVKPGVSRTAYCGGAADKE